MGEQDRIIVQELKARFPAAARAHLVRLILYGSRARGEAATDSDLDLIALVDEKTPEIEAQLDEAAYQVMWDHDFRPLSPSRSSPKTAFGMRRPKGTRSTATSSGKGSSCDRRDRRL